MSVRLQPPLLVTATTTMTIRTGTCSWTDPTLLKSGWYPPEASSAEQRLVYYASQFSVVEVDSTYYALPSERNASLWDARTPADFTFHVKAYSLITGHGAAPKKLPPILRDSLPPDTGAGKRQIYMKDLPDEAQRWIWGAFDDALAPLRLAGKLSAVLFQFPPWFTINRQSKHYLETCRANLPETRLAVEFRHHSWLDERNARETLDLLRALGLTFVCVDEPQGFQSSVPLLPEVTEAGLAVLRLHGRNAQNWEARGISAAERFRYLYTESELDSLLTQVQRLAEQAEETHVLFNNCYSDYGVRNAAQMAAKLQPA